MMRRISDNLNTLADKISAYGKPISIAILGLGSVGSYLFDYLMAWPEPEVEIHVCGRSKAKVDPKINIMRIANAIRHDTAKKVFFHEVDLESVGSIASILEEIHPDFIVNSSRVYSHLKYGTISWKMIRAYGLWAPLAVKYIRNIMRAYESIASEAIVINTSYSDAVNRWVGTSGIPAPHFGSGNLNHLIPRIKFAVSDLLGDAPLADIEVVMATSHFHDVVISKEGHCEGVPPLISIRKRGETVDLDVNEVYRRCAIPMPTDETRNMMNASSDFEIIEKIVNAIRSRCVHMFHSPGVDGLLGGYPVRINFSAGSIKAKRATIIEDYFSLADMKAVNNRSIYLDGIESVEGGILTYTDELLQKVEKSFGAILPKSVPFDRIDEIAQLIIDSIIIPSVSK